MFGVYGKQLPGILPLQEPSNKPRADSSFAVFISERWRQGGQRERFEDALPLIFKMEERP